MSFARCEAADLATTDPDDHAVSQALWLERVRVEGARRWALTATLAAMSYGVPAGAHGYPPDFYVLDEATRRPAVQRLSADPGDDDPAHRHVCWGLWRRREVSELGSSQKNNSPEPRHPNRPKASPPVKGKSTEFFNQQSGISLELQLKGKVMNVKNRATS